MNENPRLTCSVIGAGPVGLALAKALADAGHKVLAIATSDADRQDLVTQLMPGLFIGDVDSVASGADLVLFAIPGNQISSLVADLVENGSLKAGQILISTSPDFGYEVFEPAYSLGVIPLALHPAIRFTGFSSIDRARLQESYVGVDGPEQVLPIAQMLAMEIGGEPIHIPSEARKNYAEAISVAGTFTNLIVGQSIKLLEDAGVSKPRNLLSGILRSSLEESLRNSVTEIDPADLLEGDID
ncbi:MAG: DUF2520 domain-containing protein [Rhodoluna sp.]|jgi:predicted short-subunit dehydrogenase-like oxidoreductase (DUF2520 family)